MSIARIALTGAAAVLAVLLAAGLWWGPRAVEAAILVEDIVAGTGPSRAKASAPPVVRAAMPWHVDGRSGQGMVYLPGEGHVRARAVLVPGLAENGRDHPLFVAFAESLARAGFAVLAPDIPGLGDLRAGAKDVTALADAARVFSRWRGAGDPAPVMMAAVSYGVGPMVLAAADPAAAGSVGLVVGIGGYAEIEAAIAYAITGWYRGGPAQTWVKGTPNAYGKWAFLLANARRLQNPDEAAALERIAASGFRGQTMARSDFEALGAEGLAVLRLIRASDPAGVPGLIAELPEAIRADIAALDVARADLSAMRARAILIHGEDDAFIPAGESRKLARLIGEERTRLVIGRALSHVEFEEPVTTFADGVRLGLAAMEILAFRDDPAAFTPP